MGTIKVKLSNNYGYGPTEASSNYLEKNRIEKFSLPKVYQWQLVAPFDYSRGFGVVGQPIGSTEEWVGFSVCFSLNQTTGLMPIIDKTLDQQAGNGEITQRQRDLAKSGLQFDLEEASVTGQVYIDAAKNLLDRMNEVNESGSDLEINYQFDLNTVPSLEKSTIISDFDIAPYFKTKTPVGSGLNQDIDQRPAFFNTSSVWSDGSARSFFAANYYPPASEGPVITKEEVIATMQEKISNCNEAQRELLDELRAKINGKT